MGKGAARQRWEGARQRAGISHGRRAAREGGGDDRAGAGVRVVGLAVRRAPPPHEPAQARRSGTVRAVGAARGRAVGRRRAGRVGPVHEVAVERVSVRPSALEAVPRVGPLSGPLDSSSGLTSLRGILAAVPASGIDGQARQGEGVGEGGMRAATAAADKSIGVATGVGRV